MSAPTLDDPALDRVLDWVQLVAGCIALAGVIAGLVVVVVSVWVRS